MIRATPNNDTMRRINSEMAINAYISKNIPLEITNKSIDVKDGEEDEEVSEITIHSTEIRRFSSADESSYHGSGGLTITLRRYDEEMNQIPPTHQASQDSKYTRYPLMVDLTQNDKAVEIIVASTKRPHMRGFHAAWTSFFACFFIWFSLAPLLGEVQKSLSLSQEEIWYSSMYSVAGSAFLRIIVGPLCDIFGARKCVCVIMFIAGFSTMFQGLVKTATGLYVARLIAGFAGGSFVTCVYWTTTMFTKEVAGTANALAAGWGNLGGGVAQLVMGSILFPLFRLIYSSASNGTPEQDADRAWRTAIVVPGIFGILYTFLIYRFSDDNPKGNVSRKAQASSVLRDERSGSLALLSGIKNHNTWILLIQYGCSFGVETTINNLATLYFVSEFGLPTASAAAIASVFGFMNIFARGIGGFISDYSYSFNGMKGRLISHSIIFILEGSFLIIFASSMALPGSVIALAVFSIFVQMAEGSTYGIVPNVDTKITGSISGLVGSGGNVGGIIFSLILSVYPYRQAMKGIGLVVIASAALSAFVCIPGHNNLFTSSKRGEDSLHGDGVSGSSSGLNPDEIMNSNVIVQLPKSVVSDAEDNYLPSSNIPEANAEKKQIHVSRGNSTEMSKDSKTYSSTNSNNNEKASNLSMLKINEQFSEEIEDHVSSMNEIESKTSNNKQKKKEKH